MLLDWKVTENDCNCEKYQKHYYEGNLLNKNVTAKIKIDPCSKEKKKKTTQIYCDGIQKIMLKYVKFTGLHPGP